MQENAIFFFPLSLKGLTRIDMLCVMSNLILIIITIINTIIISLLR